MSALDLAGVTARYDRGDVLAGVDLSVADREIMAVLGPSGCGKTTLLRVAAGFHRVSAGEVTIGGRVVSSVSTHVAPERRQVGIVPQEGSLFPHLTVAENVGFGLRERWSRAGRVAEMLELVGLASEASRMPRELSGGQQQRVALARALAPEPAIIVMDEPFSALDAHLREDLRRDVKEVLRQRGATALLVTHDQQEAMGFADRLAVIRSGLVAQVGTPRELYARPADRWVAEFVGDAVVLDVLSLASGGRAETVLGTIAAEGAVVGGQVLLRPEQVALTAEGRDATVSSVEFRGREVMVALTTADGRTITASGPGSSTVRSGDVVGVSVQGTGHPV